MNVTMDGNETIVTPDDVKKAIPWCNSIHKLSIAQTILFFWYSTAKLHVQYDVDYDMPVLSHNGKDVNCRWEHTPVLEPGLAEFIAIGISDPSNVAGVSVLALLASSKDKDGVVYRQGQVFINYSAWVNLGNREWKIITVGEENWKNEAECLAHSEICWKSLHCGGGALHKNCHVS